jgi:hypothetical protein
MWAGVLGLCVLGRTFPAGYFRPSCDRLVSGSHPRNVNRSLDLVLVILSMCRIVRGYIEAATYSPGLCLLRLLPRDRGVGGRCPCEFYGHLDGTSDFRVAEDRCVSIVSVVILEGGILV